MAELPVDVEEIARELAVAPEDVDRSVVILQ